MFVDSASYVRQNRVIRNDERNSVVARNVRSPFYLGFEKV